MHSVSLRIIFGLCLLLAASACGNKGPLTLPVEETQEKTQSTTD